MELAQREIGAAWGQEVKPWVLSMPDVKPGPAADGEGSDRGMPRTGNPSLWT